MVTVMANDRLMFAIGRIERAFGRVEHRLIETPHRPCPPKPVIDQQLQVRHDRLREHVKSALTRIDVLINSAESR